MKSKKTTSGYQVRNKNNDGIRYYSYSLTDCIKYCPFGCAIWSMTKHTYGIKLRFFWMSPFRKIWYDKYSDVFNIFHIHIGWELMKGEVPVEIVYEPKDEPRKEF